MYATLKFAVEWMLVLLLIVGTLGGMVAFIFDSDFRQFGLDMLHEALTHPCPQYQFRDLDVHGERFTRFMEPRECAVVVL